MNDVLTVPHIFEDEAFIVKILKEDALLFKIDRRCYDYLEEEFENKDQVQYFDAFKTQINNMLLEVSNSDFKLLSITNPLIDGIVELEFIRSKEYSINGERFKPMYFLTDVFMSNSGHPEFAVDFKDEAQLEHTRENYLRFKAIKWIDGSTVEAELERIKNSK